MLNLFKYNQRTATSLLWEGYSHAPHRQACREHHAISSAVMITSGV